MEVPFLKKFTISCLKNNYTIAILIVLSMYILGSDFDMNLKVKVYALLILFYLRFLIKNDNKQVTVL